jgi:hypothetical protein
MSFGTSIHISQAGGGTTKQGKQRPAQPAGKKKTDPFAGFEFADDLPDDGVSNDEFAAFLGNISTKKK